MYLRISFKSQMLGRGVGVHAFLPFHDGYEDAQAPYPTLYFLPGYSANAEELATLLPLRRFSAEYGVAVIIPDGENSFYTDHPERCALFSSYVGDELVRVTRRMLPCLSARREDTWIGGISMGGYGACTNGLRWHDTFSKIVMFSPAIDVTDLLSERDGSLPNQLFSAWMGDEDSYRESWMNPRYSLLKAKEQGMDVPPMFLCCGRQDALVYDMCSRFADFARKEGLPLTYLEGEGQHDIPFWDGMLEPAFRFMTESH